MIGSRRCGYVEGRNLSFVLRFSPGDPAAVDATLPELMQIPADLMVSYGASQRKTYFRLAAYADRLLRGEKPADLPIEQPTHFELVLNAGTARELAVPIPPVVMARADEVLD